MYSMVWKSIIIPMQLCNKVLIELHNDHPGIVRMKSLAWPYVWWPAMDENIEHISKACENCQLKHALKSTNTPMGKCQKPLD